MKLHLGIGYISGNMDIKDNRKSPGKPIGRSTKSQQNIKGNGAQRHWNAERYAQR